MAAASKESPVASSSRDLPSYPGTSQPNEFYVTVELYLSKSAMAARKSQIPRRKIEKRESMKTSASYGDLHQRKIKEKSSWLGLSRSTTAADQWRSATCKLVEEDEGCCLNVYLDDTALYQSIYVHKLSHTDIRQVHHSLFDRKDCLGIFCNPSQTWNPTSFAEPIYLHFADSDSLNTWLVLLRSHATPEVYGRFLSARDGGLYRMWRQVELVCLQGRNLGIYRAATDDANNVDSERGEGDGADADIYCEFFVNGVLSGRTTVKKGLSSPDWHEKFAFMDLPPFENLEILVFKEKKLFKPILIGNTVIPLMNFRRGEHVEGWFPVLNAHGFIGNVMGEIRLKLKVDEEIVLPFALYSNMLGVLQTKNILDWVSDLDSKLDVKNVSDHIIAIAKAKNMLMQNIMELADREVDGTPQSHGILFRGNTVFTKTMEIVMAAQGGAFLEASVGSVIRRLCSEKVAIEIDPARNPKKNVDKHAELLVFWCQEFWKSIYDARKQCPDDMRKLFAHIRQLIEERYGTGQGQNRDLPWQGVSSFLFLRFFVPAILHPHLFGIWPGLTEDPVQRTLTLIAKVMQSLANLNTNQQKEHYMRPVQDFLTNSNSAMIDYITHISSPDAPTQESYPSQILDKHERMRVMNALNQRHGKVPILFREAIPPLTHMIDLPKHLAVITSVVVRHTRRQLPTRTGIPAEVTFDEFCLLCLQVEEHALRRVSQLASRRRAHSVSSASKSPSFLSSPSKSPSFLSSPPTSPPPPLPGRERRNSMSNKLRSRKAQQRQATAPEWDPVPKMATREPEVDVDVDGVGAGRTQVVTIISAGAGAGEGRKVPMSPPSSYKAELVGEPQSMPAPRPAFMHHPRSSSTDSALGRKQYNMPRSPSMPLSSNQYEVESPDDASKKPKGLLRGILRR